MAVGDKGSRQATGGGEAATRDPGDREPHAVAIGAAVICGAAALESLVNEYLLDQALIVDVQAILERVETRLEYLKRIGKLAGAPDRERARECLKHAVADQLDEDYRELQKGHRGAVEGNDRDQFLVTGLGVKPQQTRSVAVAYNALALKTRRAFYEVAVHTRPLAELMAEVVGTEWKTPEDLRQDVVLALNVLMGVEAPKR